ncbi:venom metalloproteinase 2-like [Diachasmimorpha longicaudata]|uniref:venom metalloproteinase 2-like n=1 Tax=Diachasmimorpha longicaudata TaxID=58733 RepID=UPI0030B8F459
MKRLMLLLFVSSCASSYAVQLESQINNEEFPRTDELNNNSDYGFAQVRFPKRAKRDLNTDEFFVNINIDGEDTRLNLTLTEKILMNNETPVWNAARNDSTEEIEYTLYDEIMEQIGDFDFYQDYVNRAAIVVFHDDNSIEGWVNYYRFEEMPTASMTPETVEHIYDKKYLLKKYASFNHSQLLGTNDLQNIKVDHANGTRTPPEFVYPQILIQLNPENPMKNETKTLRRMIAYWNAVDMLFNVLENPKIKINVAGIIIPRDNYSDPWITSHKFLRRKDDLVVDPNEALEALGQHFSKLRQQFPDYNYDFLFSFTADTMDQDILGITRFNVSCWDRQSRIAIVNINTIYSASAHELGHIFSTEHDYGLRGCARAPGIMSHIDKTRLEFLTWSVCSRDNIAGYFRRFDSQCLDNCPSTIKNCKRQLTRARNICLMSRHQYSRQKLDCAKGVKCRSLDPSGPTDIFIPVPDCTIARRNSTGHPKSVCVNNRKMLYRLADDYCHI